LRHGCDLRVMGPTSYQTAPPRVVGERHVTPGKGWGFSAWLPMDGADRGRDRPSGHPVVAPFEPGEYRYRCYADGALV
jgi:hypothetical protein